MMVGLRPHESGGQRADCGADWRAERHHEREEPNDFAMLKP